MTTKTYSTPAKAKEQRGFTIIELMIATTVVSVILVMVSVIMINIGGLYFKGISQTAAQNTVRSISDEITQQLQFSDSMPEPSASPAPDGVRSWCIGTTRYTYIIGKQIGTDTAHVLWRDKVASSSCPSITATGSLNVATPALPGSTGGGVELIGPRSMLTDFTIITPSPYRVTINIALGDSDQLCDIGTTDDCNDKSISTHIWNPTAPTGQIRCKGNVGAGNSGKFCGTANLTTTAVRRLP